MMKSDDIDDDQINDGGGGRPGNRMIGQEHILSLG